MKLLSLTFLALLVGCGQRTVTQSADLSLPDGTPIHHYVITGGGVTERDHHIYVVDGRTTVSDNYTIRSGKSSHNETQTTVLPK